ncbi:MAG: hypothetical protein KC561_06835, partial [Myxococcales bacterium]|nr:hypothetical protein [Myxococcales bacterium]
MTRMFSGRVGAFWILVGAVLPSWLTGCPAEEEVPTDQRFDPATTMYCGDTQWTLNYLGAYQPQWRGPMEECFRVETRDEGDNVIQVNERYVDPVSVTWYQPIVDDNGETVGECIIHGVDPDGGSMEVTLGDDSGYCVMPYKDVGIGLANYRWAITGGIIRNVYSRDLGQNIWTLQAEADVGVYLFESDDPMATFGTFNFAQGTITHWGGPVEATFSVPETFVESTCEVNGCYQVVYTGAVTDGGNNPDGCDSTLESFGAEQDLTYHIVQEGELGEVGETLYRFSKLYDTCRFVARDGSNWLHFLDYDQGTAAVTYQSVAGGNVCALEYT